MTLHRRIGRTTKGANYCSRTGVILGAGVHEPKETSFAARHESLSESLGSPLSRLQLGTITPSASGALEDDDEAALERMASPRSVMSDEVHAGNGRVILKVCHHFCHQTLMTPAPG